MEARGRVLPREKFLSKILPLRFLEGRMPQPLVITNTTPALFVIASHAYDRRFRFMSVRVSKCVCILIMISMHFEVGKVFPSTFFF